MNRELIIKFILIASFIAILYIVYSRNNCEQFVVLESTTFEDCLGACTGNKECSAISYDLPGTTAPTEANSNQNTEREIPMTDPTISPAPIANTPVSGGECRVSKNFGELEGANVYIKKDKMVGTIYIGPDYREYPASMSSPNIKTIDWTQDTMNEKLPLNTFDQNYQDFVNKRTDEFNEFARFY
jgi:hypothetical protein